MLAYASMRVKTSVLTNAMLLRRRRLERLLAIDNDNLVVQVSLDGGAPEHHDAYRGQGTWAKTVVGARLDNGLSHYLGLGYRLVAAVNSDGPTLPLAYLCAAFEEGREADVVLGPSDDGGYYLIGLKRPAPRLLREVRMSTPHVTTDTLALAAEEGLKVALLPTWYDVDDAGSLARLSAELATAPPEVAPHTQDFLREPR